MGRCRGGSNVPCIIVNKANSQTCDSDGLLAVQRLTNIPRLDLILVEDCDLPIGDPWLVFLLRLDINGVPMNHRAVAEHLMNPKNSSWSCVWPNRGISLREYVWTEHYYRLFHSPQSAG